MSQPNNPPTVVQPTQRKPSFFDKIAEKAKGVADATSKKIEEWKAPPSVIHCSNPECKAEIETPSNLFDWQCVNPACHKANARELKNCTGCNALKPASQPPVLTCSKCGTPNIVPTSNASKAMKEAGAKTKQVMKETADSVKETYQNMKSKPSQFNCEHCNNLLAVPAPLPWTCPRPECANVPNDGNADACATCKQPRDPATRPAPIEQKVRCGVCNKVTTVPATNFSNKMKSGVKEMDRSSRKMWYDVTGKTYVLCPRCSNPLKLLESKESAGGAGAGAPGAPGGAGSPTPDASSIAVPAGEAVANTATPVGQEIICPKCNEKLVVLDKTAKH